jgi:hypothetical protein
MTIDISQLMCIYTLIIALCALISSMEESHIVNILFVKTITQLNLAYNNFKSEGLIEALRNNTGTLIVLLLIFVV